MQRLRPMLRFWLKLRPRQTDWHRAKQRLRLRPLRKLKLRQL